jgi:hypothetical protein
MGKAASLAAEILKKHELSATAYETLILVKSIHSRYGNYVHWLRQHQA